MMFLATELDFWQRAIRGLMAMICQLIYPLIAWMYNLFMNIAQVNILSLEQIKPIYQRVTMLLTIIMVFYVTFQFVKYIVQPDQITDKEKGAYNVIYKLIIVVVLIAFVPKIFEGAYWVQDKVIKNDLIGKVLLGQADQEVEDFGKNFSGNLFSMFYRFEPDEELGITEDAECDGAKCSLIVDMNLNMLRTEGSLDYLTLGLNYAEELDSPVVGKEEKVALIQFDFNGFLAVIVGCLVLWMLAMYCIDLGTRWAQLIFLQIVAPIPIIGYLSPKKDGIFQKWLKQCTTTYLDLFLRIAIIYFVLLISQLLTNAWSSGTLFEDLGDVGTLMKTLIYVALILGVMMFAQKAPKLLGELFPKSGAASGEFGLKPRESVKGLMKPAGRVIGATAGAVTGAAAGLATGIGQGFRRRNSMNKDGEKRGIGAGIAGAAWGAARGLVGGTARGLVNGGKKGNILKNSVAGAKNQIQSNQRFGNRQENGYTLGAQIEDKARGLFGAKSRIEVQEAQKAPITRHDEALKKVADTRSQMEKRALDKITEGGKGGDAAKDYAQKQQRLKALQEDKSVRDKEFKVAKFTDDKEAQDAYDTDVELAKASVNKSNFIDPTTGAFDKEGYEAACNAAASKINASDYSVAYKTEADAQAAYQAAVAAKKAAVDSSKFTDQAAYQAALAKAEASVSAEIYTKGYATQDEADKALGEEIQRQRKAIDDAKDAAVAEYISTVDDGAIDSMLTTLAGQIREYNTTAAKTDEMKDENGNVITFTRKIDPINIADIKSNFTGFSDYVKKGAIKEAQDRNTNKLVEIDAEIQRIKSEQEGSGINEGKK